MVKILVIYQDWNDWFTKDYARFEYWFKKLDGGYDIKNEYHVFAFGNISKTFQPEKNLKVTLIKSSPKKQLLDLFKFRKTLSDLIRKFKPNYIYSPFIYLLSVVPKSSKYKIVGFLRDNTPKMIASKGGIRILFSKIFSYLDSKAFKNIDILLFNSFNLRKYAKSNNYTGKLVYSPRLVQDINEMNKKSTITRNSLGLNDKKIILTVARLSSEKNLEMNLKALQKLDNNYILLLVGEGPEKQNLVKLAKKLEIVDRIKFIKSVPHKKIWDYYKLANIFWLMSKTEGLPNVLNEALYAEVPVIVSKIPEMKDLIKHQKTGLILKSWKADELAQTTEFLMSNNKLYVNIQKQGKLKIDKTLKKHVKLIEVFK